jgi:hypothetical protein
MVAALRAEEAAAVGALQRRKKSEIGAREWLQAAHDVTGHRRQRAPKRMYRRVRIRKKPRPERNA